MLMLTRFCMMAAGTSRRHHAAGRHRGQTPAGRETRHRPDGGDQELGPRRRWLLLQRGHAAEDMQRDAAHAETVTSGDEGVRELVQQHGHEAQQRGHEPLTQ